MQHQHDTPTRVVLRVDRRHVEFIRREFEIARDGRLDDLARFPGGLLDPPRTREQAGLFDDLVRQLLAADVLVGDRTVLEALLADLAASTDAANDYRRVTDEHDAYAGLLGQLDRPEVC